MDDPETFSTCPTTFSLSESTKELFKIFFHWIHSGYKISEFKSYDWKAKPIDINFGTLNALKLLNMQTVNLFS